MATIKELQKLVVSFRDSRDWKQFHNPKDLAISLLLESNEVLEHFQWKNWDEILKHIEINKKELSHELADVLYWVLLMANDLDIDLWKAFDEKLEINEIKYPIEKSKGRSDKYTKL